MLADALAANPDNALIALTLERVARANRANDDTLRALRARVETTEDPALRASLSLDLAVMLEADGQIDAALEALAGAEHTGTARFRLLQMMERIASHHDRPTWVVRALEAQAHLAAAAGSGADGDDAGDTAVQVFDGQQGWKLRPFLGRREVEAFTPAELAQAQEQLHDLHTL